MIIYKHNKTGELYVWYKNIGILDEFHKLCWNKEPMRKVSFQLDFRDLTVI